MGLHIGALHMRRSAFVRASPERVWREFETAERIRGWLDRGHRIHAFDARVGGAVRMSVVIDGVVHYFGGTVLVMEPQRELSLSTQWEGELATSHARFWTIRLTPLHEGTLVELFHHGFERVQGDAGEELEGYESGWDNKHLIALRQLVERAP